MTEQGRGPRTEAGRDEGPAAQRLEAFLEGLPRGRAKTQVLIDFGTVLRDANAGLRAIAAYREEVAGLREALRDVFAVLDNYTPDSSVLDHPDVQRARAILAPSSDSRPGLAVMRARMIEMVVGVLPPVDDEGNEAADVAAGMADALFGPES